MKRIYNNVVEWILIILAVMICCIPLILMKLLMKLIIKIAESISFVVTELLITIKRITNGLIKRLSVKD